MRRVLSVILLACLTQGCGGGGGGGDGDSQPTVYFVDVSGDDANTGLASDDALATIAEAVSRAGSGDTVVVAPGVYAGGGTSEALVDIVGKTASAGRPLLIRADNASGEVLLEADGRLFGVRFTGSSNIVLDGFVIRGARGTNGAGVQVRADSNGIVIRHNEITEGVDGVRIEDSNDTLVFNNLIHSNSNRGIRIAGTGTGSRGTRVVNNTVAFNANDGISGTGDRVRDTLLRNNIIFDNGARGIDFSAESVGGYDADFNLVFPTTRESISVDYGPATPKGLEDVSVDPLFVGRFQLPQPASGDPETSAGIDAGDPATAAALADELRRRSTATNQLLDAGRIDLGFHFPSILQPQPTATGAPGTPTVGPTVVPAAEIYVRVGGNDTNSGRSPDQALRTIQAAVEAARAGTEVIVGPGVYAETVEMTRSGTAEEPILLRADVSGSRTGDSAGPVVVDGSVARRGFFVDGASFVIIDGFTVINTVDAAIQVRRGAESVVIRNTEIYAGREDGIRVQDSPLVTLLNNLIYCNGRRGIVIAGSTGSANARVINNTVVGNRDRGVFIGTSTAPSAGAVLRNNLLQDNCSNNLQVATNSLEGYSGQYNLVSSPSYVGAMVHPTDTAYFEGGVVNRPAGFVSRAICNGVCRAPVPVPPSPTPRPTVPPLPNPPEFTIERGPGDFRLRQTLAGDPPPDGTGVDQGDPSLDRAYTDILRGRTTATNGVPDGGRIDIGYHFPR